MATIASLRSWVPGALTPSVQSKAVLRFAGRNLTISVIGIDPRTEADVSNLVSHMRQGTLASLYRASNAKTARRPAGSQDRRTDQFQYHARLRRGSHHDRHRGRHFPLRIQ